MKKRSFINVALLGLFATFLFNCAKKDDPAPSSSSGPTFEFVKRKDGITKDTTVKPGATVKIVFEAKKGASELKSISIKKNGTPTSDKYNIIDDLSMLNLSSPILDSVTFTSSSSASGTIEYSFSVTARNGDVATKTIKVTYFDAVKSTTTEDIVALNDSSSNSSTIYKVGGFYSISKAPFNFSGSYLEQEASSYASAMDFCYIYDHTGYKQYLAAPSDPAAKGVYPSISSWSVTNATKFVETSLTPDQYKNATGADIETYAKAAGVESGSSIVELRRNNDDVRYIYAMKTASGKYALIDPYSLGANMGIAVTVKRAK